MAFFALILGYALKEAPPETELEYGFALGLIGLIGITAILLATIRGGVSFSRQGISISKSFLGLATAKEYSRGIIANVEFARLKRTHADKQLQFIVEYEEFDLIARYGEPVKLFVLMDGFIYRDGRSGARRDLFKAFAKYLKETKTPLGPGAQAWAQTWARGQ